MQDIRLTQDLDLAFADGDLVLTDPPRDGKEVVPTQRAHLLLMCQPGEIPHKPLSGVHLQKYINGNTDGLIGEITQQLMADGLTPIEARAVANDFVLSIYVNADTNQRTA